MKTITIEKNLYDFEEVREKALEKNRYCLVDDYSYWYDETLYDAKKELEKIGFLNADIQFSGFCSQGDGACFDADIDVEKMLDYLLEIKKFSTEEIQTIKNISDLMEIKIEKNHWANHYCHEKTRYIDIEIDFCNHLDDEFDSIEKGDEIYSRLLKATEEIRLEKCIEIYNKLEDEYDYLTSDSVVADWLNDAYWFNEDGSIYESK